MTAETFARTAAAQRRDVEPLTAPEGLGASSFDEAYCLPSQEAVTVALRTQQIIAHEIGVTSVVDALGGSYALEHLTTRLEQGVWEIIEKVVAEKPEVREQIDSSAGYFAGRLSGATVAVVGVSRGLGVLVDKENQTRTYMDIDRFDLGVGVGVRGYSVLSLIEDGEMLEGVASGINSAGLSTETSVGEGSVVARTTTVPGVTTSSTPRRYWSWRGLPACTLPCQRRV